MLRVGAVCLLVIAACFASETVQQTAPLLPDKFEGFSDPRGLLRDLVNNGAQLYAELALSHRNPTMGNTHGEEDELYKKTERRLEMSMQKLHNLGVFMDDNPGIELLFKESTSTKKRSKRMSEKWIHPYTDHLEKVQHRSKKTIEDSWIAPKILDD